MKIKAVFQNSTFVGYKELKNVISKDKINSAMSNVFIDLEENRIVATNGSSLVTYPIAVVSSDTDIRGVVVNPLLFDINKWTIVEELKSDMKLGFYDFEIRDDGYVYVICQEQEIYRAQYYSDLEYPNWKSVMNNVSRESVLDMRLSSDVLGNVTKSLPSTVSSEMKLKFNGSNKGVLFSVDCFNDFEIEGVIMPLVTNE